MTQDEDFSRYLRERIGAVGPAITVDTTRVVARARRRRAVAGTCGALALTVVLGGTGWAVDTEPWNQLAVTPAGHGAVRVTGASGEAPPTARLTTDPADAGFWHPVDPADAGWPDAAFWHTVTQTTDGPGTVSRREDWSGHTRPGLLVADGDLAHATGVGPSAWGDLMINGTRTLIYWDELYRLPSDPAALETLIRASSQDGVGPANPDDKVFNQARDLVNATPAPPPLRRALWAIMSGLPGAKITTHVADATGRPGSLLEYSGTGGDYAMVFDPADGRLLEQRSGHGVRSTVLEQGPATGTPVEPTLASSGCVDWKTC